MRKERLKRIQTQKPLQKLNKVKIYLSEHIYKLYLSFFMICSSSGLLFEWVCSSLKCWKICSLLGSKTFQLRYKFFKQQEVFSCLSGYIEVSICSHTAFLTNPSLIPITLTRARQMVLNNLFQQSVLNMSCSLCPPCSHPTTEQTHTIVLKFGHIQPVTFISLSKVQLLALFKMHCIYCLAFK